MQELLKTVQPAPLDAIFGIKIRCNKDTSPNKINLGVGAYRTEEGKPYPLPVVLKVERQLIDSTNKEYLPIDGFSTFKTEAAKLLYGADSPAIKEGRVATIQCLSGTGGLRLSADFLRAYTRARTRVYFSNPTWGNQMHVYRLAGFSGDYQGRYRYHDAKTNGLDFEGFKEDLRNAPRQSVFVLHTCAHNPTGVDPTQDQWNEILDIIKEKDHIPMFDTAYLGFASGDVDTDAFAVRLAVKKGILMLASQSFAKNFGLYNERTGLFSVVCATKEQADNVVSQVKKFSRGTFSNPPAHGAFIVGAILSDAALKKEWENELKIMAGRIKTMRKAVYDGLVSKKTPGNWDHIISQIGMFSFTGLTPAQVNSMMTKHHVYMHTNGRISMAGLNSKNVGNFVTAVDDVVRNIKDTPNKL